MLFAEANNASSVVAQILGTVVAGKVGLQVFFTKKPVFQPVFNPKYLSNCDRHINSLKKPKKLFKKLKSTRNKKYDRGQIYFFMNFKVKKKKTHNMSFSHQMKSFDTNIDICGGLNRCHPKSTDLFFFLSQ
jgi:hypothetical protein